MNKLIYITIIAIGFTLMACPYEGKVELNSYDESVKIDKKLIDQWVSFNEEGGREELMIEKGDKSVCIVSHKQFGKNNKLENSFKYRIYATAIGEETIFNIENKEGEFLYAKYGWTGKNEFYIQFIAREYMDENFSVDSVTTENLRAFIIEHVADKKLYDEKLEFYRKFSPEYEKVRMFMRKSGF